jgi:Cys-rich protein (TIGR01571 family)
MSSSWLTGLCSGCLSSDGCCSLCCPAIVFGKTYAVVSRGEGKFSLFWATPQKIIDDNQDACLGACLLFTCSLCSLPYMAGEVDKHCKPSYSFFGGVYYQPGCELTSLTFLLSGCFPVCLLACQRWQLRKKFNISGDVLNDCLVSTCCFCCSLTQQWREILKQMETKNMNYAYGPTAQKMM